MHLDYYLALLQIHIAVVGVVIAGVIALVQILNNSKPHRDITLLVSRNALAGYSILLLGLLLVIAFGTWVGSFSDQAASTFGPGLLRFYSDGRLGLAIIVLSLLSLFWFGYLAIKTRSLLDTQLYLSKYVDHKPVSAILEYLAAVYGNDSDTATELRVRDPFQPIREYIKDTAYKYYDYGTADGLKHFSKLFDKTMLSLAGQADNQVRYSQLAQYISDSSVEFFSIFQKTVSEKRKTDTIKLLYDKGLDLMKAGNDGSLLIIVHGLEDIAKISDDDDEIIAVIERIRNLCDAFLDAHSTHNWAHVAGPFDEICLSVTRISETYYLQKNNSLKTVPIIGYSTGTHRTVTAALVDFFVAYRNLGDRYTDTQPLYYFEAIESVIEVLFVRLSDFVENGQQNIGFNAKYHELARQLYDIYYSFGVDAVEHSKPELLALSLSNLRRIIKPAKNFRLSEERRDVTAMITELAGSGITTFGDIVIKGERTISDYAFETLAKHATTGDIATALQQFNQPAIVDTELDTVKLLISRLESIANS